MNRYLSTVLGVVMLAGSTSALACGMGGGMGGGQQGGHRMGMGMGGGQGMAMHAMMHGQGQQCGQGMDCMNQAMAEPSQQPATEDSGNPRAEHDDGQAEATK